MFEADQEYLGGNVGSQPLLPLSGGRPAYSTGECEPLSGALANALAVKKDSNP